ncbi:MAG: hypothetical protein ACPGSM_19585, partial [Thiolinea sp.]
SQQPENGEANVEQPEDTSDGTEQQQPATETSTENSDSESPVKQSNNVSEQIESSMETIETTHTMLETLTNEIQESKETNATTRNRMQKITESLQLIDNKLLEAYDVLDNSRSGISNNSEKINDLTGKLQQILENEGRLNNDRTDIDANLKKIEELVQSLTTLSRDIRANSADLNSQKSLIEDNSIRLYELLIQLQELGEELGSMSAAIAESRKENFVATIKQAVDVDLNRLWLLLSTVLVFFGPLAFVLSGSQQSSQQSLADGTDARQGMILACLGVFLGYFVLGFGLMYGPTASGWVGIPTHLVQFMTPDDDFISNFTFTEFVLYKTGFAMFGALIVYTAAGQKLSSVKHMLLALFVGAILVPIYGHWVTSGHFVNSNQGWLQAGGFVDQAGANTINTVTGWFALIICWKIGGDVVVKRNHNGIDAAEQSSDPVYSSSATLLLWLSWMGFTTGMLPISSGDQISNVMLNAGLAASAGGITAFLQYVFFNADKNAIARGLAGFVTGLVAIGACAQSVTFVEAAFLGAVAGILQNTAYRIVRSWLLVHDWQVKAAFLVAIHGVAGIWGALCYALLGTEGSFSSPNVVQLGIQVQGVAAAVIYSIVMANIAVFLLRLRGKASEASQA